MSDHYHHLIDGDALMAEADEDLHVGDGMNVVIAEPMHVGDGMNVVIAEPMPVVVNENSICGICLNVCTWMDGVKCRQCVSIFCEDCANQTLRLKNLSDERLKLECPVCRVKFPFIGSSKFKASSNGFYSKYTDDIIVNMQPKCDAIRYEFVKNFAQRLESFKTRYQRSMFFKDIIGCKLRELKTLFVAIFNRNVHRHIVPSLRSTLRVVERHESIYVQKQSEINSIFLTDLQQTLDEKVHQFRKTRIDSIVAEKREELLVLWRDSGFYQEMIGLVFERYKCNQQVIMLQQYTFDIMRLVSCVSNNSELLLSLRENCAAITKVHFDMERLFEIWLIYASVKDNIMGELHNHVYMINTDEADMKKSLKKAFLWNTFFDDLGRRFATYLEENLNSIIDDEFKHIRARVEFWNDMDDCMRVIAGDIVNDYAYRQLELGESLPSFDDFFDRHLETIEVTWIHQTYFRLYVAKQVLTRMEARYFLNDDHVNAVIMRVEEFSGREEVDDEKRKDWLTHITYEIFDQYNHFRSFLLRYQLSDSYKDFRKRVCDPAYFVGYYSHVPRYRLVRHDVGRFL